MKRISDAVVSFLLLILFALPMAFIACAIRVNLGKGVIFFQIRPGKFGKPFKMAKFRTMADAYTQSGELLPDAMRLTRFGSFLRSTSLDELPELWNVLVGDMSLVGPRPLLMEYLPLYSDEQARRHDVLPGITGWAQVNGRNAIGWEERFKLDVWYTENQSFCLDVKILCLTIKRVWSRDGINAPGEATMSPFKGNKVN